MGIWTKLYNVFYDEDYVYVGILLSNDLDEILYKAKQSFKKCVIETFFIA